MTWFWIIAGALVSLLALAHFTGIVRFDAKLHGSAWGVAALVLLTGGWMAFDGGRALIVGDYVTPTSGEFAGQLGPWTTIVSAVGIAPRSTLMKSIFFVHGLAYLAATAAFLWGASRAWWAILGFAVLGLWFIPFGAFFNIIVIVLLLRPPLRQFAGSA